MIRTLRESKAKLSELVERASQGEEILITVRGKVKARLGKAETPPAPDAEQWAKELRALHERFPAKLPKGTMQAYLDESREDRL